MLRKVRQEILLYLLLLGAFLFADPVRAEAAGTKIHFIALPGNTDAILLESNGHFGMVDCGEDWDYPDGSDSRYPLRDGVVTSMGFEAQVIAYLKKSGVKSLDFIVATHAHSDHIGCLDELLEEIPCKRLYIQPYTDASITGSVNLWDNRYVYDNAIRAAKAHKVQIISTINQKNKTFKLGDMVLTFINYGRKKYAEDDNENSLTLKVTAYGHSALLTGDITEPELYAKWREIGRIDLLKLSHHGAETDNSARLLELLGPTEAVATRGAGSLPAQVTALLSAYRVKLYNTNCNAAAVLATFTSSGIRMSYTRYTSPFLFRCLSKTYYLNAYGRAYTGSQVIAGKTYVFNDAGACVYYLGAGYKQDGQGIYYQAANGTYLYNRWISQGGSWIYFNSRGYLSSGWERVGSQWYYFNKNGIMQTGWIRDNGSWYYLLPGGAMATQRWQMMNGYWYYLKADGRMAQSEWIQNGGQWYYLDSMGLMRRNCWLQDGGAWYYLNSSGAMMRSTWVLVAGRWYYLDGSGRMLANTTVDGYHLGADGAML